MKADEVRDPATLLKGLLVRQRAVSGVVRCGCGRANGSQRMGDLVVWAGRLDKGGGGGGGDGDKDVDPVANDGRRRIESQVFDLID